MSNNRYSEYLLICLIAVVSPLCCFAQSSWDNVERIVAIGDVHGDYEQFATVLRDAGLVDRKMRWRGGGTHLVQVGDVPDRGPDTRRIMDLLMTLQRQASKAGGRVHALIGNHESMNLQGDLRYVHPGEYAAFVDRRSKRRRDDYYQRTVAHIKATRPQETWPSFDETWKAEWENRFPLGYVEHRTAWLPTGKYGKWVLGNNAVVRINDTLFVHGGLSPELTQSTLEEINQQVRAELASPASVEDTALVNVPDGPLWYRGLAVRPESIDNATQLTATLERFGANRIVVAHTPRMPAVLPRFDGRVLVVDVGLSAHYSSAQALLVIEGDEVYALQRGSRLTIPTNLAQTIDYLNQAAALEPDPTSINKYLVSLATQVPEPEPAEPVDLQPALETEIQ